MKTQADMVNGNTKAVGYLSAEFLVGKQLRNALLNAGLTEQFNEAVEALASPCRMSSTPNTSRASATAVWVVWPPASSIPLLPWAYRHFGYGIQYKYGIFKQEFDETGKQIETPDDELANEEPWGHIDYNRDQKVSFGGEVVEENGKKVWKPAWSVRAVPVDYMVPAMPPAV